MRHDGEINREALGRAWDDLWRRVGTRGGDARAVFDALSADYTGPGRHYHNIRHISQCLEELDGVRAYCEDADAVEAAVWFHDWVYDPTRSDNEEASAARAAQAMRSLGAPEGMAGRVWALILDTKHAAPPTTADGFLLVDIDLSILGRPAAEFDAYERAIRLEYQHVPEADFRAGRAKILRRFLDRPGIYGTDVFRRKYEDRARENLGRSIRRLEGTACSL
jgi:predicted metal-dependent HD superfamily phosphohydrolase